MLAAFALLTACGTPTKLRPLTGMGDVPVAEGAQVRATPAQLMEPTSQARPDRKADLVTRSEERRDDPFDLPPGGDNGRPVRPPSTPAPDSGT
jgi:hypothetical protein